MQYSSTYPMQTVTFECLTDEELVAEAHEGNNSLAYEYLIFKYRNFVKNKSRAYFLIGGDKEDILQEGMIGLYKAVRDFRRDKQASFRAFAELCITRQIITAIKTATRQKHMPLNSYISLNKQMYDDDDRTRMDVIPRAKNVNPEELMIYREGLQEVERTIGKVLSELECQVLRSYLDGKTYQEIAADLDRHVKSIDNALQRVKRKLEKCFDITGRMQE